MHHQESLLQNPNIRSAVAKHILAPNDRAALRLTRRSNMNFPSSQWEYFAKRLRIIFAAVKRFQQQRPPFFGREPDQKGVVVIGRIGGANDRGVQIHIGGEPDRTAMGRLVAKMLEYPELSWYIVSARYLARDAMWGLTDWPYAWDTDWFGPPFYDLIPRDFQAPLPREGQVTGRDHHPYPASQAAYSSEVSASHTHWA